MAGLGLRPFSGRWCQQARRRGGKEKDACWRFPVLGPEGRPFDQSAMQSSPVFLEFPCCFFFAAVGSWILRCRPGWPRKLVAWWKKPDPKLEACTGKPFPPVGDAVPAFPPPLSLNGFLDVGVCRRFDPSCTTSPGSRSGRVAAEPCSAGFAPCFSPYRQFPTPDGCRPPFYGNPPSLNAFPVGLVFLSECARKSLAIFRFKPPGAESDTILG